MIAELLKNILMVGTTWLFKKLFPLVIWWNGYIRIGRDFDTVVKAICCSNVFWSEDSMI